MKIINILQGNIIEFVKSYLSLGLIFIWRLLGLKKKLTGTPGRLAALTVHSIKKLINH